MARASTQRTGTLSRPGTAPVWLRRAYVLAACVSVAALVAPACSGENPLDPPQNTGGGGPDGGTTGPSGGCADGDQQECHVTIGEHDGVLTCLDGVQTCAGGAWGQCEGVTRVRSTPARFRGDGIGERIGDAIREGEYAKPLSLSDGGPCDPPNPCDPRCQEFDEQPDGGITIEGEAPPFPWTVGDINTLPESIVDMGTNEPCTTAEDCQFDQFCDNPSRGTCSHHPCVTGTALLSSCSACVQKICDANPACCKATYIGNCLHDPCASGSALKADCDPCVTSICATRPGCCEPLCATNADCQALVGPTSTCNAQGRCSCSAAIGTCPTGATCTSGACVPFWGSGSCVPLVTAAPPGGCGKTCPSATWNAACVAMVESKCGALCDVDPPCSHDKCYTGLSLNPTCDPCVTEICNNVDPNCCITGWSQTCVDYVESVCVPAGLANTCPAKGLCTPWPPDTTNGPNKYPNCAGVDLTVGVPCLDTAPNPDVPTVPVCNRGNSAAPAGVSLVSYPASPSEMPSSAPNEVLTSCSPPPGTFACTTTAPIPPGECIDVPCPGLTDGMQLMVNPAGAGQIAECHCENNWSVYVDQACQSPGCVAAVNVSTVKKVSLFVWLDSTGSMRCSLPCTTNNNMPLRWLPVVGALKSFFQSPASAGLNVALRFWPENIPAQCDDSPSCPTLGAANGCNQPRVPLGELTAPPGDPQETALIAALDAKTASLPMGDTTMLPALDGATYAAIQHKIANPDEEVAVLFITDGIATLCGTDYTQMAPITQNAFYNYGVRTHVIGFGNCNPTVVEQLAAPGGGAALYYTSTGASLEADLNKALQGIRGDAVPCDVTIPVSGISDPSLVEVHYVSSAGVDTTLTPRVDLADCIANGDGYYYLPGNTIAKLCPNTCATVQADEGAQIQAIFLGCETSLDPFTHSEVYHGVCPPGTKVQWGYFAYDTTTLGDSDVQFEVRAANVQADLGSATWSTAATARVAPTDTQICAMTGPSPCPIDLYDTLGGLPDARHDYLELRMTLNPASNGVSAPTVHDWEITYSCPDSE